MDYLENRLEGNVQQKNNNLDLNRYHTADQQQKTGELMLENAHANCRNWKNPIRYSSSNVKLNCSNAGC